MSQEVKQERKKDSTIWNYNGYSFVLDLEEQDDIERFEEACAELERKEKEIPKDGKLSEMNRKYCEGIFDFFDMVLGKGSAKKIFNGKRNSRLCDHVYFEEFIPFVRAQSVEKQSRQHGYTSKYKPNREQRRQQDKQRNKRSYYR